MNCIIFFDLLLQCYSIIITAMDQIWLNDTEGRKIYTIHTCKSSLPLQNYLGKKNWFPSVKIKYKYVG